MPRRTIEFVTNEFYHIYNRGNNKERIFLERKNYFFFLEQMRKYVVDQIASIHAFCLLPNHYHLLLRIIDQNEFSKCFGRFMMSYAKSVNKLYGRVGHLFQGRFQAKHVDKEEYLLHLTRYIHLNPVFAGLVKNAEEWEFSSYSEYLRNNKGMVQTQFVLSSFSGSEEYRRFVESYPVEEMQQIERQLWV